MSRGWRSWALMMLVAGGFAWAILHLFHLQFAAGDSYPEFSSFRTDRLGTRLLFDSLAKLPGITVERNLLPMEFLPRDGAVLLLLGAHPTDVNWNNSQFLQAVERLARRGNRVVLALHFDPETQALRQQDLDSRPANDTPGQRSKPKSLNERPPIQVLWGVSLKLEDGNKSVHPLYFGSATGWNVRDEQGGRILAVERAFDKGPVLLMAESGAFSNASVVGMERLPQVSAAIGEFRRIVFDEQHLGVAESGSVVGMARQFRLMGLALGLAILAGLFIWRNASSFPPPAPALRTEHTGRTSHAGLLTLLRRHVPTSEVAGVCWREWLSTNQAQVSPEVRSKAAAILAGSAVRPVEATREIQALLRTKGEM